MVFQCQRSQSEYLRIPWYGYENLKMVHFFIGNLQLTTIPLSFAYALPLIVKSSFGKAKNIYIDIGYLFIDTTFCKCYQSKKSRQMQMLNVDSIWFDLIRVDLQIISKRKKEVEISTLRLTLFQQMAFKFSFAWHFRQPRISHRVKFLFLLEFVVHDCCVLLWHNKHKYKCFDHFSLCSFLHSFLRLNSQWNFFCSTNIVTWKSVAWNCVCDLRLFVQFQFESVRVKSVQFDTPVQS